MTEQIKEEIKIAGGNKDKKYLRENIHLVYSTTEFTEVQMNLFFVSLKHIDIDPENVEEDRIYRVEFHRSEIPRFYSGKSDIEEELETLNDIKIKSTTESGWTSLKPFPKVGAYNEGTIQIWFLGEYLKPILKLKKEDGWAVFLLSEMLSLRGYHAKKLFSIFASVKNRHITRLEHELDYLKNVLGVPDKYKSNPSMFMKKVILSSIEQINKKTSIQVEAAYQKKKGAKPAMVVFDVHKKEKLNTSDDKKIKAVEQPGETPKNKNEENVKKYFQSFEDGEKRFKCYKYMIERYGFSTTKAMNCAKNDKTMKLFWKWNQIKQAEVNNIISKNEAQKDFFKELKANQLKI